MKFIKLFWIAAACAALMFPTLYAQDFDLSFGGPGKGNGTFGALIRDICFDSQNNLYVLDGLTYEGNPRELRGNALVQIFDNNGKFQREFSVRDETVGEGSLPMKIAVDRGGNVFLSRFPSGEVLKYSKDGTLLKRIAVPRAYALTSDNRAGQDWIAVAARQGRIREGVPEEGADEIVLIEAASGDIAQRIKLSTPVIACQDIAVDSKSNFFLLSGETAELFKFAPSGKFLMAMGSGRRTQDQDGSALYHSVAVDSKDNIYSLTPGNPANIVMFDPDFKTARLRGGGFDWFDAWVFAHEASMALDNDDRIWVVSNGNVEPNQRHHRRPAVVRAAPGFLDSVDALSTTGIGLKTSVSSNLIYDIAYAPAKPMTFEFTVAPARRRVDNIQVKCRIYDSYKNTLDEQKFDIPLEDGKPATRSIAFTPPQFDWYTIICTTSSGGEILQHVSKNIGVTPDFGNMTDLKEGESVGGWNDPARQYFAGLRMMRLATGNNKNAHDELDKNLTQVERYPNINFFGIFTDVQDVEPANVRAVVERFKGRVKYWEVINEPNLGHVGPPEKYMEFLSATAKIIKEIDPNAKVVGPNTCGIDLNWNRKFLELGGGKLIDVYSVHDYEGHESLDPIHWRWKYGELKKLLDEFGLKDMPLWQTERGWTGIRQDSLSPMSQAVRTMLHRDLLETFGIPSENNHFYYLTNGGFGGYPAFLWSQNGPHIGPLATRVREALVKGKKYAGELDFGPTGNKIFMGIRFSGEDEDLYIVRNLGFANLTTVFTLEGTDTVTAMDWAGNTWKDISPSGARGTLTLTMRQMPTYIRVAKGGTLTPLKIDFGKNIAGEAKFTYNGAEAKNITVLNNGIMEVIHAGHPHGGTGGERIFREEAKEFPQMLEFTFPAARVVDKMLIFSLRADNTFCALLDFDVQYFDEVSKEWDTVQKVRTPIPMSEFADAPYSTVYSWLDDTNAFVVPLEKPVNAAQFRLVILNTTAGVLANDTVARKSSGLLPGVHLREIEIYGPGE